MSPVLTMVGVAAARPGRMTRMGPSRERISELDCDVRAQCARQDDVVLGRLVPLVTGHEADRCARGARPGGSPVLVFVLSDHLARPSVTLLWRSTACRFKNPQPPRLPGALA